MSNTKATIVVVDRKHFLVMELKDDTKDSFARAIGQSIYSTSKAGVLSYVAIFENLWKQSELNQEIKESNEKLKNNDKMQKEFINTATHELRTPLQPIISLSQLLKDKTKDKEQKGLLDIIIKNAKRLKGLTEDILDVTKIEGDKLNLNKNAFDIVDLLQSLIKEFKHSVGHSKEIKFEIHFKNVDSNTFVFADRNRIIQVISNLIDNSIKFIAMKDDNGLISINVEKIKINNKENESSNSSTDGIIISIKDNGKGIDSKFFPRLFNKFASNSFQGTGLGLFIAKNIVE
ncbi:MAG: sensor histidine kinase, partial [Candidatus Nitrosocosmicus sp.]